ncbi:MAG: biotin/lipoyl-binding carrier protein [Lachnospiraceae bacterium]|nr:biotin/lipoyl-binding carrier protein [Lachnospiraceae bacterium]
MSNYKITVNGITYDVTVEDAATAAAAPAAPAATAAPAAPVSAGGVEVTAPVIGKIWKIIAAPGSRVSAGDDLVVLESMKMEIPVVAPQDGVIASVNVKEGDSVEVGDLIVTLS